MSVWGSLTKCEHCKLESTLGTSQTSHGNVPTYRCAAVGASCHCHSSLSNRRLSLSDDGGDKQAQASTRTSDVSAGTNTSLAKNGCAGTRKIPYEYARTRCVSKHIIVHAIRY